MLGDLGEGLSVTGQIVARGVNDFDANFEWAYISYEINDNWTVQAGKKRLPLFYYSDFFDVGYAYVWMRNLPTIIHGKYLTMKA